MHRIASAVIERAVNALGEYFWPQATMNVPLLIPDSFESARRHFTQQRGYVWPAECAEAYLRWIAFVRVAVVHGRVPARYDEEGFEVGLKEHVNVHPLAQVAPVARVASRGINPI